MSELKATPQTSLRLRLLIGTLFWIIVSIIAAGWGLGSLFRQHVTLQFHHELQTHLDQLTAHLALDEAGQPVLSQALSDPRLRRPYSGLYWQVDRLATDIATDIATASAPASAAVLRSRSLWDQTLRMPQDALADGALHRHRTAGPEGATLGMLERSVQLDGVSLRLAVAADEALMIEPIERFNTALWLALGILGLGLALAALVQVFVGLAPLRKLQAALARVRDGEVQRLEGGFPKEIMPLVDDFNRVLAQNAEVVARARTQAGNLAHALKTPLSVLANAAAGQDGPLARQVLNQVDSARKQVDYHLARAQAAASARLPGARTPVAPIIDGLVRTMRHIHAELHAELNAERQLELVTLPIPADLAFRGEAQDLQEMLGNLLDNACKWAAHRIQIEARMEQNQQQDRLLIQIDDDGIGIAAEQRQAVLQRGVRADQQAPGNGLGLAIVADLADLYDSQMTLAASPLGGLRISLSLPAAARAS
jgi:signal transduction histidine kinase